MKVIKSILIEFKNDNCLFIQDIVGHHISLGYLDVYVGDDSTPEARTYHIDISEIRYWELIKSKKEIEDE